MGWQDSQLPVLCLYGLPTGSSVDGGRWPSSLAVLLDEFRKRVPARARLNPPEHRDDGREGSPIRFGRASSSLDQPLGGCKRRSSRHRSTSSTSQRLSRSLRVAKRSALRISGT